MASWIRGLFGGVEPADRPEEPPPEDDLRLAAAALMMESARLDDTVDESERDRIRELVQWRFKLSEEDARALIGRAEDLTEGPAHWHSLTTGLRDRLNDDERVQIIEMLWDVAYADGELHHLEANLLRRVASLLNVTDRDSGAARRRAIRRHGLTDEGAA
jgi:uncharacterized tellurite resistance protein B-like protein